MADDLVQANDLVQAKAPFMCTVEGVSVYVRIGDVYPRTDPVVTASPVSFQDIEVLRSTGRNALLTRRRGAVETATAAPGEARTLTAPVTVPGTGGRQTKKAPAAAAPSEV